MANSERPSGLPGDPGSKDQGWGSDLGRLAGVHAPFPPLRANLLKVRECHQNTPTSGPTTVGSSDPSRSLARFLEGS